MKGYGFDPGLNFAGNRISVRILRLANGAGYDSVRIVL
jgi:hypothetical protein